MKPTVATVFSEVLGLPAESINDETSPENTPEWDSLQAMNLLSALEEAYNVRFSTKEMLAMRTVRLVRETLKTKGVEA